MDEIYIKEAAKEHALEILGEDQSNSNKEAFKAIQEDFKAGAKWMQERMEEIKLTENR